MLKVHEKRCTKCGETKPIDSFGRAKAYKDGHKYWCKSCCKAVDAARLATPEGRAKERERIQRWSATPEGRAKSRARGRRFYVKHRDRMRPYYNEKRKAFNDKNRRTLLDLLGARCKRCGFDDVRALQIDHINGGGTAERRATRTADYYRRLLKMPREQFLRDFQCLCANCNWIKRFENVNERGGRPV